MPLNLAQWTPMPMSIEKFVVSTTPMEDSLGPSSWADQMENEEQE